MALMQSQGVQLSLLHQPSSGTPTERTEPTEASCREGSPTDSTDLHRFRRVWYPAVPTQPLTQPTICVDQCNPWENCIPTEPTERTEASCREKSPTEPTERTEASCREKPPTDSTDLHRCRRVWHPAIPTHPLTQPIICVDLCYPWENYIPQNAEFQTRTICVDLCNLWENILCLSVL